MIGAGMGTVEVITTDNRGVSAEEYASMARHRIIKVSETAPEPIRQQAEAFGDHIEKVVAHYITQALKSDRTTIAAELNRAGYPELARAIQKL